MEKSNIIIGLLVIIIIILSVFSFTMYQRTTLTEQVLVVESFEAPTIENIAQQANVSIEAIHLIDTIENTPVPTFIIGKFVASDTNTITIELDNVNQIFNYDSSTKFLIIGDPRFEDSPDATLGSLNALNIQSGNDMMIVTKESSDYAQKIFKQP